MHFFFNQTALSYTIPIFFIVNFCIDLSQNMELLNEFFEQLAFSLFI